MKKTQIKDIFRNISKNAISWLAIVVVTMIVGGAYCAVHSFMNAMEQTASDFFDRTVFEDLMITSPTGVTEEDFSNLLSVENVLDVEGAYRISGAFLWSGEERVDAEILSVNERISRPELLEGAFPTEQDECAVPADMLELFDIHIGDSIKMTLPGMKNALRFTVTGSIQHPEQYVLSSPWYVFLPQKTLGFSAPPDRFNYVLIDADIDGNVFSEEYFKKLETVSIDISDELSNLLDIPSEKEPGFSISERNDKAGFTMLNLAFQTMNGLGLIFTVVFTLVGCIVVFSTITVIIDEQKKMLGSMKAFGFRNSEIMLRYIIYSESAVIIGMISAVGLSYAFQRILQIAMREMFCIIPEGFSFEVIPFSILTAIEILLAFGATVIAARRNIHKYSAVELMNWSCYASGSRKEAKNSANGSLYSKLILRNMKMDLPRVLTSIVIIGGSCLLIGVSMTLRQAVEDAPKTAMKKVTIYDLEISLPEFVKMEEVKEALDEYESLSYAEITKKNTYYRFDEKTEVVSVVAADPAVYKDYILLNTTDGRENIKPNSRGVLLVNRIAEINGINTGDTMEIFDESLASHEVRVAGSVYNYLDREIFVAGKTYEEIFGYPFEPDTLLIRLGGTDREELTSDLSARFPGLTITRKDKKSDITTAGFNAMVMVMILLSLLMSVFVLLNLVNIFVNRRKQELVIMRINGFSHGEDVGYLLREAVLTIVCGLLLATALSCVLTEPLVHIIENTDFMAVRSINWAALGVAAAIEALFALIMYQIAFRHIRHLSMVDA